MKLSLINQREVRRHTVSFAQALKASLREDPDVIVVGEMRDIETMRLAVMAAETGHLVLATLHTPTAVKAVDRIIDSFPAREQKQIRITLADSIKVVIGQSLLPGADGKAQIACYEVMMATPAISNLIREEKTTQIPAIMQIARKAGMRSFDHAMLDLVTQRRIKPETAFERAQDKELFRNLVSKEFLDQFYST
jgi:twitching motility protein PilT